MTLAEVMTQKLIAAKEGSDASVPPTLPQPFFDIARYALRRDPRQRWTLTQISEALASTPAAIPQKQVEPMRARPRYLVPVLVIAALVAVLIVTAFLRRSSGPVAPASQSSQTTLVDRTPPPATQPKPSPRTAAPATAMQAASPQPGGGGVQQRVAPDVSRSALHTITGHIRISIRANVDSSGNVTDASFATRGPSQYFARAAMNAAKQWKFTPPVVDGQAVASRWMIRFKLSRSAVDDSAEQLSR
jgi:TonB family protein